MRNFTVQNFSIVVSQSTKFGGRVYLEYKKIGDSFIATYKCSPTGGALYQGQDSSTIGAIDALENILLNELEDCISQGIDTYYLETGLALIPKLRKRYNAKVEELYLESKPEWERSPYTYHPFLRN